MLKHKHKHKHKLGQTVGTEVQHGSSCRCQETRRRFDHRNEQGRIQDQRESSEGSHTICAFANDYEETYGGYIVIGVSETNGIPDTVVGVNEWETSTELRYSKITKVVRTCIESMMDDGLVRYLYPDNPRDPRQKICLKK